MKTDSLPPRYGPSAIQFEELFPFHFVFDSGGRLHQVGKALQNLCPHFLLHTPIDDYLIVERPIFVSWNEALSYHIRDLFILRLRDRNLLLRGQIIEVGDSLIAFAGSPWVTDLAEARKEGIRIDELAVHDASLDLIHAIQAQRMAAADHQRLVERLKIQRAELQRAIAQLKSSEAEARKLAHVAARTHNAVIITDPEGRVEWVNSGFTRITGYELDEIIGAKPGEFLQGPQTDRSTVDFIRNKLATQTGFRCSLINYSKEGRRYWVEMEVQPVLSDIGDVSHYVAIEQDVTDRQEEDERRRLQQAISTVLAESDSLETGLIQALRGFATAFGTTSAGCWAAQENCLVAGSLAFWNSDLIQAQNQTPETLFARAQAKGLCTIKQNIPVLHPCPESRSIYLVLPCRAAGRIVAAILLNSTQLDQPTDDLLKLLTVLGNLIGQFIVRTQTRLALEHSRNFAHQVMNLMGQGLTVSDEQGRITFANKAFATMVGLTSTELIGRSPAEFSPLPNRETLNKAWQDRQSGKRSSYELMLQPSHGDAIPVWVAGVPRMENGRFAGSIAVVTDLTDQKRVQEQMATALARERELNQLKSAFVTMASHEFRTPLASIVYASEMLESYVQQLPADRAAKSQRYVGIILESAQRMGELMNDLLLLGRIESGRLSFSPTLVDLAAFAESLRQEAGENSERIQIECSEHLPATVQLDSSLLRHALLNLLGNALKYSPPTAPVHFSAQGHPTQNPSHLVFIVKDHGCGIPITDHGRIFQPFFRASNVGKLRGTGIGLTIARDCTRLHGGELTFESQTSAGTTFTLKIPFHPQSRP